MSKTLAYVSDRRGPIGEVGIELEVEGVRRGSGHFSAWPHVRNWVSKGDGSLRNGQEYVTRTPVKVDDKLKGRIGSLVTALSGNVTNDSIRTSCHVHVNVLPLTPIELVVGCTSFWLVEEILSDYWGEERKGNSYALRLSDGMNLENVISALGTKKFFKLPSSTYEITGLQRYSALNLSAFEKHGSVEFRGMRGTVDTDILHNWVRTVHHIMHTASKRYKTPIHLIENYMNTSNAVDFLKKICGPHISNQLDFSEEKLDKVNDNAIKLAELAYMHEEDAASWDKWEADLIKERSKRSETNTSSEASNSTGASSEYADTVRSAFVEQVTVLARPTNPTETEVGQRISNYFGIARLRAEYNI